MMSAGFSQGTGGGGEVEPVASSGNFKDTPELVNATATNDVTSETRTPSSSESTEQLRRRLKIGILAGLGFLGVGLVAGLSEPGPLHETALAVTYDGNPDPVLTMSMGDQLGTLSVLAGASLIASASIGLAETKR